jgi:hypothetical protein
MRRVNPERSMTCNECQADDPAPKKPMFVSSCPMAVDPRSTFSSSVTSNGADCQLDARERKTLEKATLLEKERNVDDA